jgi:hypothetical protein
VASERILYFTSVQCTDCYSTDTAIEDLKRGGYPITIITLQGKDTEVHRVPQIFVPDTGKRALGRQAVEGFIATLDL